VAGAIAKRCSAAAGGRERAGRDVVHALFRRPVRRLRALARLRRPVAAQRQPQHPNRPRPRSTTGAPAGGFLHYSQVNAEGPFKFVRTIDFC